MSDPYDQIAEPVTYRVPADWENYGGPNQNFVVDVVRSLIEAARRVPVEVPSEGESVDDAVVAHVMREVGDPIGAFYRALAKRYVEAVGSWTVEVCQAPNADLTMLSIRTEDAGDFLIMVYPMEQISLRQQVDEMADAVQQLRGRVSS